MVRLIVSIVILIVLAVLLIFNGTYMTPVNLFGYHIEKVPVVVVAIVGFVLGVLYSFVLYLMRSLAKWRSSSIKSKDREVRLREKQLNDLADQLTESGGGPSAGAALPQEESPEAPAADRPARRSAKKKR